VALTAGSRIGPYEIKSPLTYIMVLGLEAALAFGLNIYFRRIDNGEKNCCHPADCVRNLHCCELNDYGRL